MILDAAQLQRRYLQRISGIRDKKVYIGPEIINLEINNTCNLRCKFCWTHAPGNSAHFDKPNYFPWEKFVGIVRDSVDLQVDQIHLIGSGEPTMHPSFRDMMRHLEHQPFYIKVITNATFPLDYCSDVIKGDHVLINLSAIDRQQYRDLKGKDLFDRVVANIKRLVSLRDSEKPGFHIEIAYIVNSENVNQALQMREFASQLGVNSVYYNKMNVHAYNRDIALPEDVSSEISGEDKRYPPECSHGWFFFSIKPDEGASICCRIHKMHLGTPEKWSLKQIWLSTHMMNVRLMGKYGQIQKIYEACQTCPFYDKNIKRMQDAVELEKNEKAVTK
jgi:MoaA/NifB/PqqE/SkfB family radical SAM enzyme